ncbi:MAG: PKD domain-containing protein [Candidatus Thermoplasmatota archaeon]|nr:PKD domain-containing protein [Candidatus Thermoplasmatota archaeon]MDP7264546.1 PKD domain-containing protein [Candidatus Thermoplasmatota archaeon]
MKRNIVLLVGLLLIGSILVSAASSEESRVDDETPLAATEVFFGDVKVDDLNNTTDESDWYKIDLRAGAVLTLNLTVPVSGDFDIYMYDDPDYEDVVNSSGEGQFEEIVFTIHNPGYYFIECFAYDGNGSYTLKIDGVNPSDNDNDIGNATVIAIGQTKTSTMSVGSVDLQDWYKVNLTEGDHITVNLAVPNSGEYDLDVYDPDMVHIDGSNNSELGEDEEVIFVAQETGYHFIYCNASEGSGSYTLTVLKNMPPVISSQVPMDVNVTVNEGETVLFNISVDDEYVEALTYDWEVDGISESNESSFEILTTFVHKYSAGNYAVEVLVTDDILETDTFVWNLTVLDVNQIPVIEKFMPNVTNVSINEGDQLTLSINVTDVDGTVPVYQWNLGGTAINNETSSSYIFTTDYSSEGIYIISVNVTDEKDDALVESIVWTVTVVNTDRAPEITPLSTDTVAIDEGNWVNFFVNATDPDGDLISYKWFFDGENVSDQESENYNYSSDYNSADGNVHVVMVEISSGEHVINFTWKLTINNINRLPVIDVSTIKPMGDTVLTDGEDINFSIAAVDPDGETLSYTWTINETGAKFTNQSFTHNLPAGTYVVLITVEDGNGGTDSFTLTLNVAEAAREPTEDDAEDSYLLWIIIAIVVVVIIVIIIVVVVKIRS